MRILIVPEGTGRRAHTCLSNQQVRSIAIAVAVVLSLLGGVGGFWLGGWFASPVNVTTNAEDWSVAEWRQQLTAQQQSVAEARQRLEHHLDALGQRVGQLQAQVARVNALGQRLTEMAGLETAEFGFEDDPAMGGPEPQHNLGHLAEQELAAMLATLELQLQDKEGELEVLESLLSDRKLHTRQIPRGWPVDGGWVSSRYGYRNDPFTGRRAFHGGVDIANKAGAPIMAVAAGVVTYAGVKGGYGLMVEIAHGGGYVTRYGHTLAKMVEVGDRVEKGEIIAVMGSTGRSTGAHLHFEVVRHGRTVNPRKYLRERG